MEKSDAAVEAFLDELYDAAVHPELWSSACDQLAAAAGGVGAVLIPNSAEMRSVGMPHSASLQESFDLYVREGWYHHDFRDSAIPAVRSRGVMFDQDIVSLDDMARLSYYQEFLRPCRLKWFAGIEFKVRDHFWAASIQRGIDQEPFAEADRAPLRRLGRHLSRAANLAAAFSYARMESAIGAFQRMAVGAVAIDHMSRVVLVNAAALGLLGDDLKVVHERLIATQATASAKVEALIRGAVAPLKQLSPTVSVERLSGKRPLQLTACPLGPRSIGLFDRAAALILIVDPEERRVPPSEVLRDQFGLTVSEARLAERLAAGLSTAEAAEALSLTQETARFYLKSILSKTDTHRQGELVALLASLAILPRDREEAG